MGRLIGHSNAGFAAVISEAKPGDRISYTKLSDTHSGVVTLGHPTSTRQDEKFGLKSVESSVEVKAWGITSSTTLTNDWASSPLRHLAASVSSRSDNRSTIREIRSAAVRGRSIKRFHTGMSLCVRNRSGGGMNGSRAETYKPHEICESRRCR